MVLSAIFYLDVYKWQDVYSAGVGEDGNLPDGVASDGIHFGEDYDKKCLVYIQNKDVYKRQWLDRNICIK